MYKSTRLLAEKVKRIVAEHYEPGRQDRCRRWVWRTKIYPEFGICEARFYTLLNMDLSKDEVKVDDGQLELFSD